MRTAAALLTGLTLWTGLVEAWAFQKGAERYGVEAEPDRYPQDTPQKALASALKAIDNKQVDYLLAHLADPRFVDQRVADNEARFANLEPKLRQRAAFERLVKETADHLQEDAQSVKDLRRFSGMGEWETKEKEASAKLKEFPSRRVFMRRVEAGWVLENRQQ